MITGGLKKRRHSQSDHLSCSLCTIIILIISGTAKIQPVIRQNCPSKREGKRGQLKIKKKIVRRRKKKLAESLRKSQSQESTLHVYSTTTTTTTTLYYRQSDQSIAVIEKKKKEKEECKENISLRRRHWRQEIEDKSTEKGEKREANTSNRLNSSSSFRQAGRQAVQTSCATESSELRLYLNLPFSVLFLLLCVILSTTEMERRRRQ